MSYHLRGLGTSIDNTTPETARWYRLTPRVIAYLHSAYPTDNAIKDLSSLGNLVFIGFSAYDLYYMSSRSTGNIGGYYREPIGEPMLPYSQVLAAFAPAPAPTPVVPQITPQFAPPVVKPAYVAPPAFVAPVAPAAPPPRPAPPAPPAAPSTPASSKLGLYLGIAAGTAAAIGGGFWAFKHFRRAG